MNISKGDTFYSFVTRILKTTAYQYGDGFSFKNDDDEYLTSISSILNNQPVCAI